MFCSFSLGSLSSLQCVVVPVLFVGGAGVQERDKVAAEKPGGISLWKSRWTKEKLSGDVPVKLLSHSFLSGLASFVFDVVSVFPHCRS